MMLFENEICNFRDKIKFWAWRTNLASSFLFNQSDLHLKNNFLKNCSNFLYDSNIISRHELTFQTFTIFSRKNLFLHQNIDDEREQNQMKKSNDDDINVRVEKNNFQKKIQKNLSFLSANRQVMKCCISKIIWSILKSIRSNMHFFSIDFCFLFEINFDSIDFVYINSQRKIQ